MSCTNNQVDKKKDSEQKYLEQTFLSIPIHEYVKLISLVFLAQHLGAITAHNGYNEIISRATKNLPLCILIIFAFCYLNSNFKLEFSLVCTIIIFFI